MHTDMHTDTDRERHKYPSTPHNNNNNSSSSSSSSSSNNNNSSSSSSSHTDGPWLNRSFPSCAAVHSAAAHDERCGHTGTHALPSKALVVVVVVVVVVVAQVWCA